MSFWTKLDQLIASHEIIIDRPKSSAHPRFPDMISFHNDDKFMSGIVICRES